MNHKQIKDMSNDLEPGKLKVQTTLLLGDKNAYEIWLVYDFEVL